MIGRVRNLSCLAIAAAMLAPAARAQTDTALVGRWEHRADDRAETLELNADGTYAQGFIDKAGVDFIDDGRWWSRVEAGRLVFLRDSWEDPREGFEEWNLRVGDGTLTLSKQQAWSTVLDLIASTAPASVTFTRAPAASDARPLAQALVGRWTLEVSGEHRSAVFLPDGRCTLTDGSGARATTTTATYEIAGKQLSVRSLDGHERRLRIAIAGDRLTWRSSGEARREYVKVPGSEVTVIAEARAADEAWEQHTPLATIREPVLELTAPGDHHADACPMNIFFGATVFAVDQLYAWPGEGRSDLHVWRGRWFRANGRVLVIEAAGVETPPVSLLDLGPHAMASWARYEIAPDGAVRVEFDDGSALRMRLTDGRRRLVDGWITLENTTRTGEPLREQPPKESAPQGR